MGGFWLSDFGLAVLNELFLAGSFWIGGCRWAVFNLAVIIWNA